jgi:hypothetical protein
MERAAGLSRDDTAAVRLEARCLLAQSSASSQDAALFAELLSLHNDGRYPALNLPPSSAAENAGGVQFRNWKSCHASGRYW